MTERAGREEPTDPGRDVVEPGEEPARRGGRRVDDGGGGGSARKGFARTLVTGAVCYAILAGLIVVIVGWRNADFIGLSFAILFASATLGIIVGFLFGVPRMTSAPPLAGEAGSLTDEEKAQATAAERLVLNSNLARVSDWLTTIIIGLGLVQFRKVLDGLGWLGEQYESMLGAKGLPATATAGYGLALTLSAFGIAFVIMFMWTSTRLLDVLRE